MAAATRLFLDAGYAATSMDAIAAAAGVSKRTVYSHFANKEALFAALMADLCDRLVGPCPLGDNWAGPPDEVLRSVGHWLLTLITKPEAIALQRVVLAEAARIPELGQVYYQSGPARLIKTISDYLADQTAQGYLAVAHCDAATVQLIEMIKGPVHLPLSLGLRETPDADEIERVVDRAVDVFLRAYRRKAH